MKLKRIAGTAYLKLDGRQYETSGSITINPGQPMREGKLGTTRIAGYSEKPQIPSFDCKILLTAELSLLDLTKVEGATIQVVGPNGATHILRDAWFAGEGTYDTGEGEVTAKFEGASYEEVPAA